MSLVRVEGLLFLTSPITTTQNQKSRQLMSGDLAVQAMVVKNTWKSARACRAVAGVGFEGSLKKYITFNSYCETPCILCQEHSTLGYVLRLAVFVNLLMMP